VPQSLNFIIYKLIRLKRINLYFNLLFFIRREIPKLGPFFNFSTTSPVLIKSSWNYLFKEREFNIRNYILDIVSLRYKRVNSRIRRVEKEVQETLFSGKFLVSTNFINRHSLQSENIWRLVVYVIKTSAKPPNDLSILPTYRLIKYHLTSL
jgi:hypothetical protein